MNAQVLDTTSTGHAPVFVVIGDADDLPIVADPATETLSMDHEVERGAPFCSNPRCALHVRVFDAVVEGGGNWVALPDGRLFGRGWYAGEMLCDACGTGRGPVHVAAARVARPALVAVR